MADNRRMTADYYEELLPLLNETSLTVEIPVEGLSIGERMAWYNEKV